MPLNQVTVKAPATTANLGPGFDVFGLALEYPSDKVTVTASKSKTVKIKVSGIGASTISTLPERNTAGLVASLMMKEFSLKAGFIVRIEKGIWPSKGLGSSAASAAAVAFALNIMNDLNLTKEQLIRLAAKGEVASAGFEHADNVSAAICGGFVILRSRNPVEVVNLKAPANLELTVAFPQMITPRHKTEQARSVLPKTITLEQLVQNVGNAAALVSGFSSGDVDLIGKSLSDTVVEPARTPLIPGYQQVKNEALKAGACGITISGAGPAMIAVVDRKKTDPSVVADAMKEGFKTAGLKATAFTTKPGKGVSLMEK